VASCRNTYSSTASMFRPKNYTGVSTTPVQAACVRVFRHQYPRDRNRPHSLLISSSMIDWFRRRPLFFYRRSKLTPNPANFGRCRSCDEWMFGVNFRQAGYSATCQDDVDRLNERIGLIAPVALLRLEHCKRRSTRKIQATPCASTIENVQLL
jgi:hypothetical protein